jgi:hypothetical protein
MCELYCAADAIFVGPDSRGHQRVERETREARTGSLRRQFGWGDGVVHNHRVNLHWRMPELFAAARESRRAGVSKEDVR